MNDTLLVIFTYIVQYLMNTWFNIKIFYLSVLNIYKNVINTLAPHHIVHVDKLLNPILLRM